MTEYIFIDSGTDASALMFYDIEKQDGMKLFHSPYEIGSKALKFICNVHNAYRINSKVNLPFRGVWKKYSSIGNIDDNHNYVIGFTNASVVKYDYDYLKDLSAKKNVRLVLVCLDPFFDKLRAPISYINEIPFYKVFSFNEKDAIKYNLELTKSYFSKCDLPTCANEYDLYYVGAVKNREKLIIEIMNEGSKNGCKSKIQLVDTTLKKDNPPFYSRRVPYKDVLYELNKSNCLLEIVQEGQENQTLRYFEAIGYNKKLLTNNSNIVNYPYYNEQYMKIFKRPEDIDFAWIKKHEDVDYKYAGEFSPVKLLQLCEFGK